MQPSCQTSPAVVGCWCEGAMALLLWTALTLLQWKPISTSVTAHTLVQQVRAEHPSHSPQSSPQRLLLWTLASDLEVLIFTPAKVPQWSHCLVTPTETHQTGCEAHPSVHYGDANQARLQGLQSDFFSRSRKHKQTVWKNSHALEAARSWFNDLHCSSWVLEGWTHLTVEECEPPKAEIHILFPHSRKLLQVWGSLFPLVSCFSATPHSSV